MGTLDRRSRLFRLPQIVGSLALAAALAGAPAATHATEPNAAATAERPAVSAGAAVPVGPAAATDSLGRVYLGMELMRLTNLDRKALGKATLAPDPVLAAFARDKAVTCPSNSKLIIRGRSRDMIDRGYFSPTIKLCRAKTGAKATFADLLPRAGFTGASRLAENLGAWASTATVGTTDEYQVGCARGVSTGCKGSTQAAHAIATIQRYFMNSSGHRATLLDTRFTRFGCGVWTKPTEDGITVYATCIFARGGKTAVDRTGPAFSHTVVPAAPVTAGDVITVGITVTDARMPIAEASLQFENSLKPWAFTSANRTRVLSFAIDTTGYAPGTHTLVWTARDAGANRATRQVTFTVAP